MEMSPTTEGALREKAARVEELNNYATKALIESDFKSFCKYSREYECIIGEIKLLLVKFSVAKIHDPKTRNLIDKISQGNSFAIDNYNSKIEEITGLKVISDDVFEGISVDDENQFISDYLFSWFGPNEYINALCSIGSMVLGVSVPEHLQAFVHQARQCFAFQQYLAVYALCRTILEIAVRDVGQRKGKLPRDKGKVKQDVLRRFGDMKSKAVPKELKDEVGEIYDKASGLIHGNKTVGKADAADLFRRTLITIQALYRK